MLVLSGWCIKQIIIGHRLWSMQVEVGSLSRHVKTGNGTSIRDIITRSVTSQPLYWITTYLRFHY